MIDLEDRVRNSLRDMAERVPARPGVPPRVINRARRRMIRTGALCLVTSAIVGIGSFAGVLSLSGHHSTARPAGGGTNQEAVTFLNNMADLQDQQAEPGPIQPGQYVYTKSIHAQGDAGPTTREDWIGTDGSGRILEGSDDEIFGPAPSPPDPESTAPVIAPSGIGGLVFVDPADFPTGTDALRELIENREFEGGPPGDAETYTLLVDLLRQTQTSPHLRAATYRVIATVPGLEYVGEITDGTGRPGISVGLTSFGNRAEIIIDPDTGGLLGERDVQVDPGPFGDTPGPGEGVNADGVDDPGTVGYWVAHVEVGIVDSTSSRT